MDRTVSTTRHPSRWALAAAVAAGATAATVAAVRWAVRGRSLRHQARQDSLTGLANRLQLDEQLTTALARSANNGRFIGVLFCDVDNFKRVNDAYGHQVGDVLLTAVAIRLMRSVRATDVVARFGGDEFVVVCCDLAESAELDAVRDRIAAEMTQPFTVGTEQCQLSLSIGAALGRGGEATAVSLIGEADRAMFAAKLEANR